MAGKIVEHWLSGAQRNPSPNCDDRPLEEDISLLVIHNISLPPGEFGGPHILDFFTNQLDPQLHPFFDEIKELKVSSHILIQRDGAVIQLVPFNKRAWHAGKSCHSGRYECNDFSIGIELEGTDETPYTDAQYEELVKVTLELMNAYPRMSLSQIKGHDEIAPERKTDPGPSFDWDRYLQAVKNGA